MALAISAPAFAASVLALLALVAFREASLPHPKAPLFGPGLAFASTGDGAVGDMNSIIGVDVIANKLSEIVKLQTLSSNAHPEALHLPGDSATAMLELHKALERHFPLVHSRLTKRLINQYSILFEWPGALDLKPFMLLAHMDTVGVDGSDWTYPPYSGEIAEGYVWGRGTLDLKFQVITILSAVESLLAENFAPKRTLYIAFGHDEEVGGGLGATAIAATLEAELASTVSGEEGDYPIEMVLDEGGAVVSGMFGSLAPDLEFATLGVGEKGYASIELTVNLPGGHSSLPAPNGTAISVLTKAITRLEAKQMPAKWLPTIQDFFAGIAHRLPMHARTAFKYSWLFKPVLLSIFSTSATTNAMIRTTGVCTIVQAGVKDNVVPQHARAVVNYRLLPTDSIQGVLAHVRSVVDDSRVKIQILPGGPASEAPALSPGPGTKHFDVVADSIKATFGQDIPVLPYILSGMTDIRHYRNLTGGLYRFSNMRLKAADVKRIHGKDERVALDDLGKAVQFYRHFIGSMQVPLKANDGNRESAAETTTATSADPAQSEL